jgi:hypothetical protein
LDFGLRAARKDLIFRHRRGCAGSFCFSRGLSEQVIAQAAAPNPKSKIQNPKFHFGTALGYIPVEPTLRESASSMGVSKRCQVFSRRAHN